MLKENPEALAGTPTRFDTLDRVLIGMGKGKFIIEHAKRNPNINYIGIEKFEGVIIQACDKLKDQEPTNLHLIAADATNLLDMFEENEINKISLIHGQNHVMQKED